MTNELQSIADLLAQVDTELYNHLKRRNCLGMYFCFRWILLAFKREFNYKDVPRLWEALFSDLHGSDFHRYLAVAALLDVKEEIIQSDMELDRIMAMISNSDPFDLSVLLPRAENIFKTVRRQKAECEEEGEKSD
eukprot:TRINITY_DN13369_c0_g1_i1.p1 TRINITY_DN13369_c0_g1~~TRINITY_DN13369_c0_g1_i1.p1  ORF type:complete len:144 (-),score=29.75 TRINITY_DN13369_c0_g1_i1:25-429(-)